MLSLDNIYLDLLTSVNKIIYVAGLVLDRFIFKCYVSNLLLASFDNLLANDGKISQRYFSTNPVRGIFKIKKMEPNIYLIRHGEKDKEGKFLSKRGIKQTRLLAKKFKKIKFKKIYSSDLERCKQTIKIINKKLKLPINYEPNLREVKGIVKEFPKRYNKEIKKIRKFYNKLIKEKGNILVSSSGIVNRILLSMFLEIESDKANFIQNPTGVNLINKNPEKNRFRILHINDVSHLPNKLKIRQKDYHSKPQQHLNL